VTRQLRVMVLDTSPTTRKILEVILRREGHQVACFDDPVEALRFLSRHGPADLLFLGMDLPKMDGERDGILERLKARLAGAQLVVIKPLVRRQIVALVAAYLCQSALAR
jgi:CheY-like chemotaxis protein